MKETIKRFLSRVLCIAMLFQVMPVNLFAAVAESVASDMQAATESAGAMLTQEGTIAGDDYANVTFEAIDDLGKPMENVSIEPLVVANGTSIGSLPAAPAVEDYTFEYWRVDGKPASSDRVVR